MVLVADGVTATGTATGTAAAWYYNQNNFYVQDKEATNAFAATYQVMHRWRKMPDGAQILLIGVDNFAFPIPLKKNRTGQ